MKILHAVESYYPSVSGAPEVVRHISERMVKMGHDVTVATGKHPKRQSLEHNGVKIVPFDIRSSSVFGMSSIHGLKGETKKYQDFLVKGNFDVVLTYAAQQWTTDLMFDVLDKIKAKKVMVPCGYSGLYDPTYEDYFKRLPDYLRKFDATVYMAEDYRDINFAKQHRLKNIRTIPNGADEIEFETLLDGNEQVALKNRYGIGGLVIMTIANYTGEKGHEELLRLYKLLPVSKATLISAGSLTESASYFDIFNHQAWRINVSRRFPGKRVVMVDGSKRKEVVDLLKLADIFVFFSNVECSPLVLFEAAAAGVPFVATAAGNSSEIAKWTRGGVIVKSRGRPHGRVAADLTDAVWQVTRLAHNHKKRQAMGENARKIWHRKFTWDKIAKDYIDLYESLLKNRG